MKELGCVLAAVAVALGGLVACGSEHSTPARYGPPPPCSDALAEGTTLSGSLLSTGCQSGAAVRAITTIDCHDGRRLFGDGTTWAFVGDSVHIASSGVAADEGYKQAFAGCTGSDLSGSVSLDSTPGGVDGPIIGTWTAIRNDAKPDQVGEVCTFAADHTMTCSEPSGVAVPVATWAINADNITITAAGSGATVKFFLPDSNTLRFTDADGKVTEYHRT